MQAHAEASAKDGYPGTLDCAPHTELLELDSAVSHTARFWADFGIRYGGQAGSDWYVHVLLLGRIVLDSAGAVLEVVVERREEANVSEVAWEGIVRPRYDRDAARDRFLAHQGSPAS